MTNDPTLVAAVELLDRSLQALRGTVDRLSAEQLNARPADGANPLAVIVAHALGATESWISLAVGADLPPRDRAAEFHAVVSDPTLFLAEVDHRSAACRGLIERAETFDPARTGFARWTSEPDEPVTAAWALLHALEHLSEHVGHAELTRQLLDGSGSGS
jgi:uncharacterized damage-inducible protein DinB